MALKRLSAACSNCPYKDTCDHKEMEAVGILEPAAQPILESAAAPVVVKHDYRDIKIEENTTVIVDLEDLKKKIAENIYRHAGLMMHGG